MPKPNGLRCAMRFSAYRQANLTVLGFCLPQSYGRYKFSEKTQYKVLSNYNFAGFCGVAFIGESD